MFKKYVNVFRYTNRQNNGNQIVLLYFVLLLYFHQRVASRVNKEYILISVSFSNAAPHSWEAAWSRPSMAFVPFFLLLALNLPSLLLAQSRDSEPLVVTGEQVVFAQNTNVEKKNSGQWILSQVDLPVSPHLLVGFRREEGSWVQVPVQVLSSLIGQLLPASEKCSIFLTAGRWEAWSGLGRSEAGRIVLQKDINVEVDQISTIYKRWGGLLSTI